MLHGSEVTPSDVVARVAALLPELVEIRRDLHTHPEIGHAERRTTALLLDRLTAAGLAPRPLPGTGLVCDLGPEPDPAGPAGRVMLRADIDALPVPDSCPHPWRSQVQGVAHACGHDVHTTAVLGAGLVLADLAAQGRLPGGVRLLFQAAEEVQPGGALAAIEAGVAEGVSQVFGLHCEPKIDVGTVGTRVGPLTSASDPVTVTVSSTGGHTSRPHLTGDVVFVLGQLITQVPAVLGRRMDPRAGVNLTWGLVHAGTAHNVIPPAGQLKGSLRCLDVRAWEQAAAVLREAVEHVAAPYDVRVEVHHEPGVPPVDNDAHANRLLEQAIRDVLGDEAVVPTEQSLGGEDFGWLLTQVPGAMGRLGTRTPGGRTFDLHQGDLDVDEGAIAAGAALLARVALLAGAQPGPGNIPVG